MIHDIRPKLRNSAKLDIYNKRSLKQFTLLTMLIKDEERVEDSHSVELNCMFWLKPPADNLRTVATQSIDIHCHREGR